MVMALETGSRVRKAQDVLDNHSHQIIHPGLPDPGDAFALAELYAQAWRKEDVAGMTRCVCQEIGQTPKFMEATPPAISDRPKRTLRSI